MWCKIVKLFWITCFFCQHLLLKHLNILFTEWDYVWILSPGEALFISAEEHLLARQEMDIDDWSPDSYWSYLFADPELFV